MPIDLGQDSSQSRDHLDSFMRLLDDQVSFKELLDDQVSFKELLDDQVTTLRKGYESL